MTQKASTTYKEQIKGNGEASSGEDSSNGDDNEDSGAGDKSEDDGVDMIGSDGDFGRNSCKGSDTEMDCEVSMESKAAQPTDESIH